MIVAASFGSANIQFFTEYCLAEAIHGNKTISRFPSPPRSHERPDLVILIEGSEPLLIAIEAKLYDGTHETDLIKEMDRQKKYIFGYLRGRWPELRTIHAALLPSAMKDEFDAREVLGAPEVALPSYRREIITWEQIRDAYADVPSAAYFAEVLRIAIQEYHNLRGELLSFRKHAEDMLSGAEILKRRHEGQLEFRMIGRHGGIDGSALRDDIATGNWATHRYEVRRSTEDRPNWFPISEFVNRVQPPSKD